MASGECSPRIGIDRGEGSTMVVIVPGFGLRPLTYEPTVAAVEDPVSSCPTSSGTGVPAATARWADSPVRS